MRLLLVHVGAARSGSKTVVQMLARGHSKLDNEAPIPLPSDCLRLPAEGGALVSLAAEEEGRRRKLNGRG